MPQKSGDAVTASTPASTSAGSPATERPEALLPPDVRALHIGFHKTGTTSVQTAFAAARDEVARYGVTYPGKGLQQSPAALGVMGRTFGWADRGGKPPRPGRWRKMVREVEAAPGRVLMSSEFLEEADDATVRRIRADLGDDMHVIATVRPLGRMLSSIWQQHVKNGLTVPYGKWLHRNLDGDRDPNASFWKRHDHPKVIRRWADVVGPENMTVVVVDDSDRGMLFRSFEELFGLPFGLLESQPKTFSNRSMTAAEVELLRRVNEAVRRQGIQWPEYQALIRKGAALRLVEGRRPDPSEPMIGTPAWALARAAEIGEGYARDIGEVGVNVIGDLSSLGRLAPSRGKPSDNQATEVPIDAAVEALLGVVGGALRDPDEPTPTAEAPAVPAMGTRELVRLTSRRVARDVRDRIPPLRR